MVLVIYCAGGLGREVCELAEEINERDHGWSEIIFADDGDVASEVHGKRVVRYADILDGSLFTADEVEFVIASGEPRVRSVLFEKVDGDGFSFATLVSPVAHLSKSVTLGRGTIVHSYTQLSVDVVVGDNVYLQGSVLAGHDTRIGSHSLVSSLCLIAGNVTIEERAYIGPLTGVKQGLTIGNDSIVGMGSVVLRNVKPCTIVRGDPAKKIGDNTEGSVFSMFE